MVCVNCGKNLIRGYAFCLECGTAVPPEVLEEGGMPGRTDDEGKPAAEDAPEKESKPEKPAEVRSSMPGIEPLDGGNTSETLVFCPNCGMHMQSSPFQCNRCGMYLGDRPKNVPLSPGGVPLMNTDPMPVGGIDAFGGGLGDISDSEIDRINGFMNGAVPIFAEEDNSAPDLFGNGISANDFALLSQQLAGFSAANDMPSIEAIEREPKSSAPKGIERQVDNFSMSDDGDSAVLTENTVPVVGNCSMDEDPTENVDLDPYKFLNASLDDTPEPLFSKSAPSAPVRVSVPEVPPVPPKMPEFEPIFSKNTDTEPYPAKSTEPEQQAEPERVVYEPIFGSSKPSPRIDGKSVEPPPEPAPVEEAPFIAETAPVISEFEQPPAPERSPDIFGQSVPAAPGNAQQVMPRGNMFRCLHCGNVMYDTDRFCPGCGTPYKNGAPKPGKPKAPVIAAIAAAALLIAAGGYFGIRFFFSGGNSGEPQSSDSSAVSDISGEESSHTAEHSAPESTASASIATISAGEESSSTAPDSSAGTPPSSTGTAPSSTGAPPSSTGTAPSSTGAPPSSAGTAPSSAGTAPSSAGAPPSSAGTAPSSVPSSSR